MTRPHCLDHSKPLERMQPDPQGLAASQQAEEHPGGAHGEAGDNASTHKTEGQNSVNQRG